VNRGSGFGIIVTMNDVVLANTLPRAALYLGYGCLSIFPTYSFFYILLHQPEPGSISFFVDAETILLLGIDV
jgi:hypothetical protein